MKLVVVAVLACAGLATAAPRQILVLRAEGSADASTRTSIDAQVLQLAKNIDGKVDAGDIPLADAAALVGCNPIEPKCKDEMLSTLGVDEVVATTVTATPTGLNVTVRRLAKGSAVRAAQTTIPIGKPADAKMSVDIGPLFGTRATATPPATSTVTTVPPSGSSSEPPPSTAPTPPPPGDAITSPDTGATATAPPPAPTPEGSPPSRRLQKIGMIAGGVSVVLGALMWAKASGLQSDIDNAPVRSPTDLMRLQDLESQADGFSSAGNLFVIAGIVVGGVSGYFYWRAGRTATTRTALITPVVFPHGAGLTLTLGGTP